MYNLSSHSYSSALASFSGVDAICKWITSVFWVFGPFDGESADSDRRKPKAETEGTEEVPSAALESIDRWGESRESFDFNKTEVQQDRMVCLVERSFCFLSDLLGYHRSKK